MDISDEKLEFLIANHQKILQEKEEMFRQCVAAKDQAELDVSMAENRFLQLKEVQRLRSLAQTEMDYPHKIRHDGEWWALEEIRLDLRTETILTTRRLLGSAERAHTDGMLNPDTGASSAAASLIGWIKERMYPETKGGTDVI